MKKLNECTHLYNGRPVKVMNYMDYMNVPNTTWSGNQGEQYVLILDPQSGENIKVPLSKLSPINTLSLTNIKIVDKKDLAKPKAKKKKTLKKESLENRIDDYLEEKTKGFLKDIKKNAFHEWLGKDKDSPITMRDIQRGLSSEDPHVRKQAQFALNSRKWKHKGRK